MPSKFQAPRGTRDILPELQPRWRFLEETAAEVSDQFGFERIDTPTFEDKSLFVRAVGEGTDVVDKELFLTHGTNTEANEAQYALRPEGTAGIVRACIEHGMHKQPQPVKLWTLTRNFRYDRPQKGRYREHVQWDIEYFGDPSPFADAWILLAMHTFYQRVGITDAALVVNTLGLPEERVAYREALVRHLSGKPLSQDSTRRLTTNPLRILDSKDPIDHAALQGAPSLRDHLGEASLAHYNQVLSYLEEWGIPYTEDTRLVRGLDYYRHTCFEWVPNASSGQQSSIGGGGRYDGLIEHLGGQPGFAVGAGIGLDRVLDFFPTPAKSSRTRRALIAEDATGATWCRQELLRRIAAGEWVHADLERGSVSSQLKSARSHGCTEATIASERGQETQTLA